MSVDFAYIADDFTGATDVLEALASAGARARLYLNCAPSAVEPGLQAIGIATTARATAAAELPHVLAPLFDALVSLQPAIVQYKVCSTFDSSPEIGNIATVISTAWERFPHQSVLPVIVGAPRLGRWVVFGNLFARYGVTAKIYRLDRHPVMRFHPITPMEESDLGVILHHQGLSHPVEYLTVLDYTLDQSTSFEKFQRTDRTVLIADTLLEEHLTTLGRLVLAALRTPALVIGSSGATQAICNALIERGKFCGEPLLAAPYPVDPVLVVSGSCSRVSANQTQRAIQAGFCEIAIVPDKLLHNDAYIEEVAQKIAQRLCRGKSVIAHTCSGPDDPRLLNRHSPWERLHLGRALGRQLGELVARVAGRVPVRRIIVTGGDTSGYVALAAGLKALDPIAVIAPGAPLCLACAPQTCLDGIEFCFKGGQTGPEDFYLIARDGVKT
jgi:uncharacterized protein YgbK (DUF1537 family)